MAIGYTDIVTPHNAISLLIVAIIVALVARKLRLPYTVGLVLTGIVLALAHVGAGYALTRELVFTAFLPPLLFEAALNIERDELKRDALPSLVLSTLGVVISAAVVAAGMVAAAHWPWGAALVFGVLIAATDPVSVIATFKSIGVTGRLRFLVESESLFNDGVAAVLFVLAMQFATGSNHSGAGVLSTILSLGMTVFGGIALGFLCGWLAIVLAGRADDHLIETALTTAVAYGSFLLAEHYHLSGVLATVTAGLMMGNEGILKRYYVRHFSERGRDVVNTFWDFAAFIANSLIFLLIGLRTADIPFRILGMPALILAIVLTLAGRAISVYPLCAIFSRSRYRMSLPFQHVLFWGGLRGAMGLALALSIPPDMPYHDQIVIASFGVVAFSIVVQGISMPWLIEHYSLGEQGRAGKK